MHWTLSARVEDHGEYDSPFALGIIAKRFTRCKLWEIRAVKQTQEIDACGVRKYESYTLYTLMCPGVHVIAIVMAADFSWY